MLLGGRYQAALQDVISKQLDLWEQELHGQPWRGQSPRALTKGCKVLFLRREPQKDDCFFVGALQLELFRAAIKGSRRYAGAPLLSPLPRGDHER